MRTFRLNLRKRSTSRQRLSKQSWLNKPNVVPWFGYGAPRGTPRPVIDKIVAGFNEVMKVPSIRAALQKQALQPMEPMSTGEIAELYAADAEKYAKVIREVGIKLSE
jgi:tripartite-type tricarboxylate transporter receptor subunit TctC